MRVTKPSVHNFSSFTKKHESMLWFSCIKKYSSKFEELYFEELKIKARWKQGED